MQPTSSAMLADFAQRFAEMEKDNATLKEALAAERDAHASSKAMLADVLRQANSGGKLQGESLINTVRSADMKAFAEKSIAFCEQMRAFATHILSQQERLEALAASVDNSPDRSLDRTPPPVNSESNRNETNRRGLEGQNAASDRSNWLDSSPPFDPESPETRSQLLRLVRELEILLQEHSDKIELGSLHRLYSRKYGHDVVAFPGMSFEKVVASLPGRSIRIESSELGDFVVLDASLSPPVHRSFPKGNDRPGQAVHPRRSRSRSPRSRGGPRNSSGRMRSPAGRFVRGFSSRRPSNDEGRRRPVRAFYRFPRDNNGVLSCIYYNERECPNDPCNYAHICGECGKSTHGIRTCPNRGRDEQREQGQSQQQPSQQSPTGSVDDNGSV
ncbi:unnamed protein product (mitochondrion) [Plasmodiophora brassicae]|uniref:Uncharacterized protein n=1 Tax=Plasmodiophora brassicae TaxID=37360 RepID=A0A0G4J3S3_PLABS|nr:hypothetical protein PBRA_002465 [Plasmodiophora brassicae]SPQ93614.1 unnamed protein product [Plasmodiophora brassicae]